MNGIELIATERERQIKAENWTPKHDDRHEQGEIAIAAVCYATPIPLKGRMYEDVHPGCGCHEADCPHESAFPKQREVWRDPWPWAKEWDKRGKHDRLRSLAIAGALIAAEIDRLQRITKAATP